jgi:hypothetical protein
MRNRSRTYLLNIEDLTLPMQSKIHCEAYGEIYANKHKPTKTSVYKGKYNFFSQGKFFSLISLGIQATDPSKGNK